MHDENDEPSSWHSKRAQGSFEAKLSVADVEFVKLGGPEATDVVSSDRQTAAKRWPPSWYPATARSSLPVRERGVVGRLVLVAVEAVHGGPVAADRLDEHGGQTRALAVVVGVDVIGSRPAAT